MAGNLPNFDADGQYITPENFKKLSGGGKIMSTEVASRLLLPILIIISLRRVKGQKLNLGYIVITSSGDIPRYKIKTMELKMDKSSLKLYKRAHKKGTVIH